LTKEIVITGVGNLFSPPAGVGRDGNLENQYWPGNPQIRSNLGHDVRIIIGAKGDWRRKTKGFQCRGFLGKK